MSWSSRYRVPVVAGVLALVALSLVVLGSRSAAPRFAAATATTAAPTPTAVPTADGSAAPRPGSTAAPHTDAFVDFTFFYFCLVLVLVLLFVVLIFPRFGGRPSWRRHRARPEPVAADPGDPDGSANQALVHAVEEGLRAVSRGDAADAIIGCWVRLERVAADAGTARRPAETAGDLTARVLAAHQVTPDTLRRLADLYREARFSRHTLGGAQREAARAALEQVRAELRGRTTPAPASVTPAGPAGTERP